jgi:hypothetical protein
MRSINHYYTYYKNIWSNILFQNYWDIRYGNNEIEDSFESTIYIIILNQHSLQNTYRAFK